MFPTTCTLKLNKSMFCHRKNGTKLKYFRGWGTFVILVTAETGQPLNEIWSYPLALS